MISGHRCDVKKALSKEEMTKAQQMDRERSERAARSVSYCALPANYDMLSLSCSS